MPFLLPRLLHYFSEELITDIENISPDTGYFTFDGVPLKWHLPAGLLYDIYVLSTQDVSHEDTVRSSSIRGKAEPFRLTVHFTQISSSTQQLHLINATPTIVHDAFINSVKEADFVRTGSAKPIMSLSAADSKLLWSSTQENDLTTFSRIYAGLLPSNNNTTWRNIPLRVYLPSAPVENEAEGDMADAATRTSQGQIHILQAAIPPYLPLSSTSPNPTTSQLRHPPSNTTRGTPQTLGTALHSLLPSLFPSRRTPISAKPLLHGAVMPMSATLEEVASKACYADGWVNVVVAISG